MAIYFSLIAVILGLLLWALATNPLVKEAGKLAYFAGLLAFLLQDGARIVSVLQHS